MIPTRACTCLIKWYDRVYTKIFDDLMKGVHDTYIPYNEYYGFHYNAHGWSEHLSNLFVNYNTDQFINIFLPNIGIQSITKCHGSCD